MWWMPESPDDKKPGVLSYDPDAGMRLDLVGGWDPYMAVPGTNGGLTISGQSREWPVLFGVGDGKLITLLDNFAGPSTITLGRGNPFGVPDKQRVITNSVLVGCHLSDPDALEFVAGTATVEHLTEWSMRSGIRADIQWGSIETTLGKIEIDKLEAVAADVGSMTAKLHILQWRPFTEHRRAYRLTRVKEHASVEFSSEDPRSFREWMTTLAGVRDLMTFSTLAARAYITTRVYLPATPENYAPDNPQRDMRNEVQVYQQNLTNPEPESEVDLRDFVLTLDDLPFEVLMPRWMNLRERFRGALGMILALKYVSDGFLETQVVTAVAAAESFHRALELATPMTKARHRALVRVLRCALPEEDRQWFSERTPFNGPTLRERLLDMVARLGAPGAALVPHPGPWANAAKNARNTLAHTGPSDQHTNDILNAVVQVTSAVVVLNLLHELGFADELLLRAIERHRVLSHAANLAHEFFAPPPSESA